MPPEKTSPSEPLWLKKRIVVCCDGTWMDSDGGDVQTPSNVTRLSRCVKPVGLNRLTNKPIPQIIYYQAGVGTGGGFYSKVIGGATGQGLSEHIREAYTFICNNYQPGDEIFIIGFSRGAFTARSISSLIRAVGLLTPAGLVDFYQIFEDWQYQLKAGWSTRFPNEPWPHRPALDTPAYRRKLLDLELTRPDILVKCVAVWDTVGALGVPVIAFLPQPPMKDFSFVNTKVEPNIEYAFQALALDEHRRSFSPTVWEQPADQMWPKVLKQCWFPGVHSDVGGSYPDTDLANLTLAWMISQLDPLLDFDHSYIVKQSRLAMERAQTSGRTARPWGMGKIHDSMTLVYHLGGSVTRTPKQYTEVNPDTLRPLTRLLQNTNETVHSSVRIRMGKNGLGYNDKGTYDSEALKGWTLHGDEVDRHEHPSDTPVVDNDSDDIGKMDNVRWTKQTKQDGRAHVLEMKEDKLGDLERTILDAWPEIAQEFDSLRPSAKGGRDVEIKRAGTFPGAVPHHDEEEDDDSTKGLASEGQVNGHRRPGRMETF